MMETLTERRRWKEEEERRRAEEEAAELEAAEAEEEQRIELEMAAAEREMMETLTERKGPSTPAGDGPESSDQDYLEEYEEEKVDERERTPSPFLSTNRHYPWLYGGNE